MSQQSQQPRKKLEKEVARKIYADLDKLKESVRSIDDEALKSSLIINLDMFQVYMDTHKDAAMVSQGVKTFLEKLGKFSATSQGQDASELVNQVKTHDLPVLENELSQDQQLETELSKRPS